MLIKKENIEWFIIFVVLLFSFINSITLLASMLASLFLLRQKEIGAIKILNLFTFRTIINPGIAVNIGYWQSIKWLVLFICSFYLIQTYLKFNDKQKQKLRKVIFVLILFSVYNIVSSFLFSNLPTIAIFKLLSYSVICLGILIGIMFTVETYNWLNWMYRMFSFFILFSTPFMLLPVGYLRNGYSFQGITNQPNMFAIVASLYIALLLTLLPSIKNTRKLYVFFMLVITIYMIILSNSRTAFISSSIMIMIYILFVKNNKLITSLYYVIYIFCGLIITFSTDFFDFINSFLYKGNVDILYSRSQQLDGLMNSFLKHPLFGNGFAVPIAPFRSFSFSTEYVVEPGNLVLAVLSYSGVIGFFIFIIYLFEIFLSGRIFFRRTLYLPLAVLIINLGEMVFFSSNNIGIWCYMFIGIYICITEKQLNSLIDKREKL